jgi:hypothetical protein
MSESIKPTLPGDDAIPSGVAAVATSQAAEGTKVEALAALGCDRGEVADYLGMSVIRVRQQFNAHFRRGRAYGRVHLRRLLRQQAEEGKAAAMVWLARHLLEAGTRRSAGDAGVDLVRQDYHRRLNAGLRECLGDTAARQALLLVAERMTGLDDTPQQIVDPQLDGTVNPMEGGGS